MINFKKKLKWLTLPYSCPNVKMNNEIYKNRLTFSNLAVNFKMSNEKSYLL